MQGVAVKPRWDAPGESPCRRARCVAAVANLEPDVARCREVIVERRRPCGVVPDLPKRAAVVAGTAVDAGASVDLRQILLTYVKRCHRFSSHRRRFFALIMSAPAFLRPKAPSPDVPRLKQISPPMSRGIWQPTNVKIAFVDDDSHNIGMDILGTNFLVQDIPLDRFIKMLLFTRSQ